MCLCRLIGLIVFGVLLRNQTHFGPCGDSAFIHRRGKRKLGASESTPPSLSSRVLGVRAPFCCRVSSLRVQDGNTQCPCERIICIFHIPFSVNSQYLEALGFNLNPAPTCKSQINIYIKIWELCQKIIYFLDEWRSFLGMFSKLGSINTFLFVCF